MHKLGFITLLVLILAGCPDSDKEKLKSEKTTSQTKENAEQEIDKIKKTIKKLNEKLEKFGFIFTDVKKYSTGGVTCTVAEYLFKDDKTGFEMESVLLPPLESSAENFTGIYPGNAKFLMGSSKSDIDYLKKEYSWKKFDPEFPRHWVELTPFIISKYETTQKQWDKIKRIETIVDLRNWVGKNLPIERISWIDSQDFITGLNNIGRTKISNLEAKSIKENDREESYTFKFSLPTESQWEYACRAGTTTRFYYGDSENGDYMWDNSNSDWKTHPVGEKKSNAFGLFDMHGNVSEWCKDTFNFDFYSQEEASLMNPVCKSGIGRVLRGGSLYRDAIECRSSNRHKDFASIRRSRIGFRCVFTLTELK